MNEIKKIAIVRLSALGDIVNSAVVLQFIHKKYPDAQIEWITEEVFAPTIKEHPYISKVHTINLKKIKKEKSFSALIDTVKMLKNLGHFDIVIDMQGLLKSAIVSRLISKNTHGFDKNSSREGISSLFYKTTSNIAYDENVVKRNCFVVSDALKLDINDEMLLEKEKVFNVKNKFHPHHKQIAIVIGASWESKKFPKERVVKLCDKLQMECNIIWGNDSEYEDALWIEQHSNFAKVAPKMSLQELIEYISNLNLLIGNDTGPTHMAWAQNVPSITLFGPTTTRMIYETPINIGIESPSKVDINKIDKNDYSISEIEIETIFRTAKKLLGDS
jgi:heptosyltransferase-1